ncbi:MAG: hypothetical protein C6Y22_16945 [Hapalosiphonaceae cyanobacterium JJU2]|nr:MAG: hypothetical protein C6Y22_16945 [Hapalosiphonaceae cyanobacterium JJU2]
MRTANGSFYSHTPSTTTQYYSPSVPLSVYRDLAAELQAAQAKINALTAQQAQVTQENQLLREEIAKAIQSVLQLQKLLDASSQSKSQQVPQTQVTANVETVSPSTSIGNNHKPPQETQKVAQTKELSGNSTKNNQQVATATPGASKQQVNKISKPQAKKAQPRQQPQPRPPVVYTEMEIPLSMSEPVLIEQQEVVAYSSSKPESEKVNGWWFFFMIVLIIFLGFGAGYLVVRPFIEHQNR